MLSRYRRLVGILLGLAAVCAVALTAPTAAAAAAPAGPLAAGYVSAFDPTYGAYATAETYYDNGTWVKVKVADTAADGKCAHVALRWLHRNGTYYYDYGMYICGSGTTSGYYLQGPRNQTQYRSVDLQVFVDDGPTTMVRLATF